MNTEDLIAQLAAGAGEVRKVSIPRRVLAGLGIGLAISTVVFALLLGPRPDLAAAVTRPVTLAKTLLPLLLGLLGLPLALAAARPGARPPAPARAILLVPAIAAALFVWSFAGVPPAARLAVYLGHSIQVCLPSVVTLSLPIVLLIFRALREGAPEHPARCGALAGLASAGFGAALYSLFCTEDAPLFYVMWYGTGILIVTALGALAGSRMLRW